MHNLKRKITKEQYYENIIKDRIEQSDFIKSQLSYDIIAGYGYYGGYLKEEDGEYYFVATIGDTCD